MNYVGVYLKTHEKFGFTRTSHRRFDLVLKCNNMSKEQADKIEAAIRKAVMSILPEKHDWEK